MACFDVALSKIYLVSTLKIIKMSARIFTQVMSMECKRGKLNAFKFLNLILVNHLTWRWFEVKFNFAPSSAWGAVAIGGDLWFAPLQNRAAIKREFSPVFSKEYYRASNVEINNWRSLRKNARGHVYFRVKALRSFAVYGWWLR